MINYYIELRILNETKFNISMMSRKSEDLDESEEELRKSIKAETQEKLTFLKKKGKQRIAEITQMI